MTMEGFDKHKDACNYAKANPGFIVIRDGQEWIVGDRVEIYRHINGGHKRQRRQETTEERTRRIVRDSIENPEIEMPDADDGEYQERLMEVERDEMRGGMEDPDDWNRSTEEGWFYDDDTTPPSEPQS